MKRETFAPLSELPEVEHCFTLRTTDDTRSPAYPEQIAPGSATAEQPHGNGVGLVTAAGCVPGVDGLVTATPGLPLLIRVADCAAVFLVDRQTPAIGLIHSGKKGTELNITGATVAAMQQRFGTRPENCRAFISPCIGPCHYEMDIWAGIEAQLRATGLTDIHNPRVCTACRLDRYFSYRAERGQTGRMFAALRLR